MPSIHLGEKQCYSVRFPPNNDSLIAVASSEACGFVGGGTLYLLEITPEETLKEILRFEYDNGIFDVEWCDNSPNPSLVLTAGGDGSLQLWNVFAPKRDPVILRGHENEVHTINWSKISNQVLSGSSDFTIRLWDPSKKTTLQEFLGHRDMIYQVEFHPKSPNIFASVSGDGDLKVWDILDPSSNSSIDAHSYFASSCTWSQCEDNTIATGGGDGFIKGWDTRNYTTPLFELGSIGVPVKKIMFSPFSYGLLASITHDGKTRIWNCFDDNTPIDIMENHNFASGLDWNPSDNTAHLGQLADCGWDGYVHVYYPKTKLEAN